MWASLGVLVAAELFDARDRPPFLETCVLVGALSVSAALSRRFPLTSAGIMFTASVAHTSASVLLMAQTFVLTPWVAVMALSFLAGTRSERVRPVVAAVSTACAFTFALYLMSGLAHGHGTRTLLSDFVDWLGGALGIALGTLTPWLFGRCLRLYRRLTRGGWEIAEHMERTRAAEADRARLRERARIAARMHDSLGHDLALIAVRAAALEMAAGDGGERKAAGELRAAAHEANLRLREIIGVLRGSGEEAPETVADLAQRAAGSGMRVRLLREGPDPDPSTPAGRAVHRVVQEALTNAAKYAPGAEVTVRVVREAGRTVATVADTGSADGGALLPAHREKGSGLAALRSLVADLGGDFGAGPADGTGFAVRAAVPDSAGGEAEEEAGTSQTRRVHDEARRRARRRLVAAVAVPTALGLGAVAAGFAMLAWIGANTVLPPEHYGQLSVGSDRAQVEQVLPRFSYPEQSVADRPPAPPGAQCSFYLVRNENGLPPVYRLCFAGGVLVTKDEIRRSE